SADERLLVARATCRRKPAPSQTRQILLGRRRVIRRDDGVEIRAATALHSGRLLLHFSGNAIDSLASRQEKVFEVLSGYGCRFPGFQSDDSAARHLADDSKVHGLSVDGP